MAKSTWPGKMRRRVKSFALFAVLTLVFYLLMRRMKSDFSGTQRQSGGEDGRPHFHQDKESRVGDGRPHFHQDKKMQLESTRESRVGDGRPHFHQDKKMQLESTRESRVGDGRPHFHQDKKMQLESTRQSKVGDGRPHFHQDKNMQVESTRSTRNQACILPRLNPYDDEVMIFDYKSFFQCSGTENWVYVQNGTFRIAESAKRRGKKVTCEHWPIHFGSDDFSIAWGESTRGLLDGSPLKSDFFKVSCRDANHHTYEGVHLGVAFKPSLHKRGEETTLPSSNMGGYDIAIFGFDSVSRMSWIRNLPKTRTFFTQELGGIELEGHNILGDATLMSLLPMLTGKMESEIPNSYKGDPNATTIDENPWIWKEFKKAGYVTIWGEDMSAWSTFQLRQKGFKRQPVDHYMRPYFLATEPEDSPRQGHCAGSEPRHVRFFNYFRDMYRMYGAKRKFMFGFHSELSHQDNNELKLVDGDFTKFLRGLNSSGYLNHTILILMADHGSRLGHIRQTQQGKLEERLPYFGFHFPPGFKAAYPNEVEQLRQNRKRLTTNFDIHETLRDILDNTPTRPSWTRHRGISLFKPIPESRTCNQAGIEPHWCACLSWDDVSHDTKLKASVGKAVVDFINSLTKRARNLCQLLSLQQVVKMYRFVPRKEVLKFKEMKEYKNNIADLSDKMRVRFEYLQVSLITNPGQGHFEVTVKHSVKTGDLTIRPEDISRINKYGSAAACVERNIPFLRPYCYCKQ